LTLGIAPRRRTPRWLALGVAVAAASIFTSAAVQAAPLAGSTFEGDDGNLVVTTTGNTDWANVAGLHTGIDNPSGKTDNSFGQGTKEDDPAVTVVSGSIPPNKNDLTRFYEASEHAGSSDFLYLGWERAVNIGNANLDFEINQGNTANLGTPGAHALVRTAGDLLVTYDFAGSGTPTIGILRWLTSTTVPTVTGFSSNACFSANTFPCWGDRRTLTGTEAQAAVNTVSVSEPFVGGNIGVGLFGETAINLTAAGVFPAGTCETFGSAFLKSRSSSSFTAEMKDFVAPIPVHISNCGEVVIHKITDPAESTTSFGYTTTNSLAAGFNLTGVTTGTPAPNTKDITDVQSGSYTVTEGSVTGWTLDHITCTATGTGTSVTSSINPTASFTVASGGLIDCTFFNTKDKTTPSVSTTPTLIPQDSVTVGSFDTAGTGTGHLVVSLYANNACTGTALYSKDFGALAAGGTFATDNSGDPNTNNGYSITSDGTYYWQATYAGDSRNNGFTSTCTAESYQIDVTP
jgi:hypothetical protein